MSAAVVVAGLTVTFAEAGGPFRNPLRWRTSVEQLAEKIDELARDLQHTGRVTVKAPDVWGQARPLPAHREEFKRQMAAQLEAFKPNTNASINISDQSFLTQALALSLTGQLPPGSSATNTVKLDSASEVESTTTTPAAPSAEGTAPASPAPATVTQTNIKCRSHRNNTRKHYKYRCRFQFAVPRTGDLARSTQAIPGPSP